jgi:hypothetical protein
LARASGMDSAPQILHPLPRVRLVPCTQGKRRMRQLVRVCAGASGDGHPYRD